MHTSRTGAAFLLCRLVLMGRRAGKGTMPTSTIRPASRKRLTKALQPTRAVQPNEQREPAGSGPRG